MPPLISVVLPIYNAEQTIAAAVAGILAQSHAHFELLAINDGSKDGSVAVLGEFKDERLRILDRAENRGLIWTLNQGLQEARGELIARHDADDVSYPERFARQVDAFQNNAVVAVGAALSLRSADGSSCGQWSYPATPSASRWQLFFKTPVAHSVVMFRRDAVIEAGGYREEFKHAEDYELWSRLARRGHLLSLQQPLLHYALSTEGVSRSQRVAQEEIHVRIATRNMSELLNEQVSIKVGRILSIDVDHDGTPISFDEFVASATLCTRLRAEFLRKEGSGADTSFIQADFAERLRRLVRLLPLRQRYRALRELRAIAPSGMNLIEHWRSILSGADLAYFVRAITARNRP